MKKQSVRKAIIPVAGMGTRFLPATKSMPKEMLPVVDKPVIQYVVEEAVASGIEQIILVTGRGKHAIEDHFDHSAELERTLVERGKDALLKKIEHLSDMAEFFYVRQEKPLGNGHAPWKARHLIGDEPFALMWGDEFVQPAPGKPPILKQMIEVFDRYTDPVVAAMRVDEEGQKKYGILGGTPVEKGIHQITEVVEKPGPEKAPSNLAIMGHYILTPDIFDILTDMKPDKSGEIYLSDAVAILRQKRPFYAYEFNGTYYDCGNKLGFVKANLSMGLQDPEIKDQLKAFIKEQ